MDIEIQTKVGCGTMTLAFLFGVFFLLPALGGSISYSEGTRAGQLVKLSKRGMICKTWEGEIVLGGVKDGVVNTFAFSVTDESMLPKLQEAIDKQTPITVTYDETWSHWYCTRDTDYLVTGVK